MMIIKNADCEEWTPLTDEPLPPYIPDWDEPIEAYPDEEDNDEQDIEHSVS